MARLDELRLLAKVAHLYYERGMTQPEIARQMSLSQATVSRLLKRALNEQVVRITISPPQGAYTKLEDAIQSRYQLRDVMVADALDESEAEILRSIGSTAAFYLETTLEPGETVGISSWSETLLAMVDALTPLARPSGSRVVQILGGIGNPGAGVHATHLTRRLAACLHGEPIFLPAPGIAASPAAKDLFFEDQYVREAVQLFDQVSLALVGIGTVEPSAMLARSGNVFAPQELETLRSSGAVGDVCLHFFDAAGRPVLTPLNDRVIGMELAQLRSCRRSVGLAGGKRKLSAIVGALRGGWVNVLITDRFTAERLV